MSHERYAAPAQNPNPIWAQAPGPQPPASLLRNRIRRLRSAYPPARRRSRACPHATAHRINDAPIVLSLQHVADAMRGRSPASAHGEVPGECALPPGRVLKLPLQPVEPSHHAPAMQPRACDGKGSGKGGKGGKDDGKRAADLPLPRKPMPSTASQPIASSGKGGKGRLGFFRACGRACART